jgi:tetratricopeptide (TPR) repeat protein
MKQFEAYGPFPVDFSSETSRTEFIEGCTASRSAQSIVVCESKSRKVSLALWLRHARIGVMWRMSTRCLPRVLGIGILCLIACTEPRATIEEVRALHAAGRYQESIEPLRQLVKAAPSDPERLYLYGYSLWSIGRVGLALWALQGAMEDPEYFLPAGKLYVNSMILNEAWDDAEAICDELLEELGENTEILTLRAYARQGSRKNYEGAIEDADRVLELDPDNTDVLIPRTVALLALERVEEAGEALRELDELYRDESLGIQGSPKFCTAGAVFAMEKGEEDLARERFEHCLEEIPTSPILLSKSIGFFDGRDDLDRSLEIIERALEIEPESQGLRDDLAIRLDSMKRREDAVRILEAGTESESTITRIKAWASLAGFRTSIGEMDEAVRAYEEARRILSTESPDLDFRYADALILAGRYDDALALADRMSVAPHRSLIKGRCFLQMGDPVRSLENLSEGNRLWPNNAVARYYTAVAAERVGDIDRAIEEYRYAVRIEPGTTDAALRLANYYIALGQDRSAISTLSMAADGNSEAFAMQLLAVRTMAKLGILNQAPRPLAAWLSSPPILAMGSVAIAQGIQDRDGVEKALAYLENRQKLDLTNPRNAAALTHLIQWLPRVDRAGDALALVEKSRETRPDLAIFQALYAEALANTDADPSQVIAAYERALEMEDAQLIAIRGLARMLASVGNDDLRAIELYRKSIELDPSEETGPKALAVTLMTLGRLDEAAGVLERLTQEHPWDAENALSMAEVLLDLGGESNRARARRMADRARRLDTGSGGALAPRLESIETRLETAGPKANTREITALEGGLRDQPAPERNRALRKISSGMPAFSIQDSAAV